MKIKSILSALALLSSASLLAATPADFQIDAGDASVVYTGSWGLGTDATLLTLANNGAYATGNGSGHKWFSLCLYCRS